MLDFDLRLVKRMCTLTTMLVVGAASKLCLAQSIERIQSPEESKSGNDHTKRGGKAPRAYSAQALLVSDKFTSGAAVCTYPWYGVAALKHRG